MQSRLRFGHYCVIMICTLFAGFAVLSGVLQFMQPPSAALAPSVAQSPAPVDRFMSLQMAGISVNDRLIIAETSLRPNP